MKTGCIDWPSNAARQYKSASCIADATAALPTYSEIFHDVSTAQRF
jgi:hypothetical protein